MPDRTAKFENRIVRDPEILGGKPVIRGTRVPVERIIAHLAQCPDVDDLLQAYPRLTKQDVQAALEYAYQAVSDKRTRTGRNHKPLVLASGE
jgi:uncharacterized protein (DUF433 family)